LYRQINKKFESQINSTHQNQESSGLDTQIQIQSKNETNGNPFLNSYTQTNVNASMEVKRINEQFNHVVNPTPTDHLMETLLKFNINLLFLKNNIIINQNDNQDRISLKIQLVMIKLLEYKQKMNLKDYSKTQHSKNVNA